MNREDYLKAFLTAGEVPIDDSASECAAFTWYWHVVLVVHLRE